jgi:hypothetical protein
MTMDIQVEVTVKEGDSSTERGMLLEGLAKRVLTALQHTHVSTSVRIAGCEIDILATDAQSGARISVECKAYRDRNIAADVLTKMLGNAVVHSFQSVWLITTSNLGKDAKGIVEELKSHGHEKRQLLRIYEPEALIKLLVSVGQIVHPNTLPLPAAFQALPTRTLLITDIGEFWAVSAVGTKSGIADTVMVFDAKNGESVRNGALVQQLSERDSNLRELSWVTVEDEFVAVGAVADATLRQELDNIAAVPVADDWSDYRPARPDDFVGRDDLLKNITSFFDEIRARNTETRLLAIKAPSGWGKSSFLIKLRAICEAPRYREKIFLYAVDCRTASSSRYPELALKRCFDAAMADGFVGRTGLECRIASAGQPFSDASVRALLDELRVQNKVVVLFFDQFEEITTKQELSDLFVQIKMLCAAIESAGENIVLGFSWKTDGSIPADHPAYHIWHSFADRRKEFELPLFSKSEMSQLLSSLSRELRHPIEHGLRRLLAEHCQGYPWLLKKLCVHVFRVLRTQSARQRELLERALDVQALFEQDIAGLSSRQMSCLEKIASESPADHFKISDQYGDSTVDSLMQRRLVLRSAGKLILYWDIFRDYVLTGQVPAIPSRYMPVSSPGTVKRVLLVLVKPKLLANLAQDLGLKSGTLDNVARDLVMVGICNYDRKKGRLSLVHSLQSEAMNAAWRFFSSHVLLRRLIETFGRGFRGMSLKSVETCLTKEFATSEYAGTTIRATTLRLLAWLQSLSIVSIDAAGAVSHNVSHMPPPLFSQLRVESRQRAKEKLFVGEAAPAKVLDLLIRLRLGESPLSTDRNALYVLSSLRVISSSTQPLLLEHIPAGAEGVWLASKVAGQRTMRIARESQRRDKQISAYDIGSIVENLRQSKLSDASKNRYGGGIIIWLDWLNAIAPREATRLNA